MAIETVLIGARGYTGSELLPLLHKHPGCQIRAVGSGSVAGQSIGDHVDGMDDVELFFSDIRPDNIEQFPADLYILALPNGHAAEYVASIDLKRPAAVIIDLSADYRFDSDWVYGQPERFSRKIEGTRRIANPGCYATGAQLALAPLIENTNGTPVVFGVSGYSGAGKTPSRKNDTDVLRDNLIPYSLTDHMHEREVSHHLYREVCLLPHVAAFFRGISLSISTELKTPVGESEVLNQFQKYYENSPLVSVQSEIPEVAQVRGKHGVIIGGFSGSQTNSHRLSLVCVLDNLLKGAATQAIQNMNLAFGLPQLTGLEMAETTASGVSE